MNEEKKMNFIKKFRQDSNIKYRKVKDSINKDVGKKVFSILNILVITIFIFVIPIMFTTLTMFLVTAGGSISLLTYHIIFYLTWVILLILVIARIFFKEYK